MKYSIPVGLFTFPHVYLMYIYAFIDHIMCLSTPLWLWQVLENYNKGKTALLSAAKIMVSPTEVDLNPESLFMDATNNSQQPTPTTHHRRNSSVRLVQQYKCDWGKMLKGFFFLPSQSPLMWKR